MKNRPEDTVGEASIVFLMVLSGEVDCDEGNVPMNSLLGRNRRIRGDLSAPAKPNTRSLFKGCVDCNLKPASARACAFFRNGRSRSALGAVATFLSLVALRREH